MKKLLVFTIALIAFGASLAQAQGSLRLTWANCNTAGNVDRVYAATCGDAGTPPATQIAVASFNLLTPLPDFVGVDAEIVLTTAGTSVPDWWATAPGECRESTVGPANVGTVTGCSNPYAGTSGQGGGLDPNQAGGGPNQRILRISWARAEAAAVNGGVQYTAVRLSIPPDANDACAGCNTPASLCLRLLKVFGQGGAILNLTNGDNTCVTVNGGPPVSAKNKTWGAIKSMYR